MVERSDGGRAGKGLDRNKILDAARSLARAGEDQDISIRKIAGLLNVTPMAIYKHFENKGEIERQIGAEILRDLLRRQDAAADASWQVRLRQICQALYDALIERPTLLRNLTSQPFFMTHEGLMLQDELHAALAEAGLPLKDSRTVVRTLLTLIQGTALTVIETPEAWLTDIEALLQDAAKRETGGEPDYPYLGRAVRASEGAASVSLARCIDTLIEMIEQLGRTRPGRG